MTNRDIRRAISTAHVKHWEVADVLGIHENTFYRMMRHELPDDKRQQILSAIESITKRKER